MRQCATESCHVFVYFTTTPDGRHINHACPSCGKVGERRMPQTWPSKSKTTYKKKEQE